MAEARNDDAPTLPPRGKVQSVRQQWSVHEDGALAYQIQSEEINQHYGLNRFNRRTVREDIPVARVVQTEEEIKQQEERMRELAALKAQAEEDERMAHQMSKQLQQEVANLEEARAVDDEDLARILQEKEKKKYERHLEKKREKRLKQERARLESELAKDTEEARMAVNADGGSDKVADSMESLNIQGVNATRVTPAGLIEDEGDFSDFYNLPEEMDEFTRLEIQASQDEELARLLQEQEHKRTKAEVDQEKLRRIEQRDEQLARVMQEQEKLRLKKAKQKHQQKKEAAREKDAESLPLGASANTMNQNQHLQDSPPAHIPPGDAAAAVAVGGHHRYRRNSYTQAFDSPPSPPRSQPPPRSSSGRAGQGHETKSNRSNTAMNQQTRPQMPLPGKTQIASGGGMSTLESARRIAAGDHEGILAAQNSVAASPRSGSLQERSSRDGYKSDVVRASSHHGATSSSGDRSVSSLSHQSHHHDPRSISRVGDRDPVTYAQPYHPHQTHQGVELMDAEAPEVMRWLGSQGNAGNYSDEEFENEPHQGSPYSNGAAGFNIAAAIDPTYQRRHPEANFNDETQLKTSHVPFSRSLPQADGELEWDPGLRGSLRKTKAPIHGYQDSTASSSVSYNSHVAGGEPVMSSWQPVQGQKRSDGKPRKSKTGDSKKDKNNCKQQ